jgi:protein-disulfide isomerase
MKTSRVVLSSALSVLCLAALGACNNPKNVAGTAKGGGSVQGGDTVVATFADQKITLSELDSSFQDQLFEMRKRQLDQLILERLVKAEASKTGKSEEEYLKSEIDSKVPAPPEEELKAFYEKVKPQLPPDASFDKYKDRLVDHLTRQKKQEVAQKLFEDMRKKANVTVTLAEPPKPRKQVDAKGPSKGPADAKVTIVEFSDFQCPFCSRAKDTVDEVMQAYAGKVKLHFRHFPLDFHKQAPKAAQASLCANEQGKFWEYHDHLFKNQSGLEVPQLKDYAKAMGLDQTKFNECLDSDRMKATVDADTMDAQKAGVTGTPAFFINGVFLSGAQPLDEFKKVIDQELASAK